MASINWNIVAALATVAYVFGTFLLWWVTYSTLRITRDAFKLNLILAFYQIMIARGEVRQLVRTQPFGTIDVPEDLQTIYRALQRVFPDLQPLFAELWPTSTNANA